MTTPSHSQAYAASIGISTVPQFLIRTRDPTVYDFDASWPKYTSWINTDTKAIWYLESVSTSNAIVTALWRAVGPIVTAVVDPATPWTASTDYSYPIGQTWVNTAGNNYFVMTSNPSATTGYWIQLSSGTTGVDLFAMQTGSTPIGPDSGGIITFSGAVVAAGTNPVRTDGTASTTMTLEVQTSQAIASADATKIGLCNFSSGQFAVDSTGFVTLAGGGLAIDSFTPDTGTSPVVPTAGGLVAIRGQTVANVSGIQTTGALNELDIAMFSPFKGDFNFTETAAGTAHDLQCTHTDNTNTGSHSEVNVSVGGTSGGNPWVQWNVLGSKTYSLGINNVPGTGGTGALNLYYQANDTGGFGSGTNYWNMTTDGERTMPLQPAFSAYLTADQANVTGDATPYSLITYTEAFDQNNDFNATTGVFTAPVTGLYQFNAMISLINLAVTHTACSSGIIPTSATQHWSYLYNPVAMSSSAENSFSMSALISMTAGDTAYLSTTVSGGTLTVGVRGTGAAGDACKFSGYLVC